MAVTVTRQVILDGRNIAVIKCHLVGDATAEETNAVLVDASDLNPGTDYLNIEAIDAYLTGFAIDLHWQGTPNVDILSIPADSQVNQNYRSIGRLQNNAGPGRNGDILFSTRGMTAADEGTIILVLRKKAL